ncbi:MAG: SulP family inorganic anion transporter [Sphingomicrobium sp.]
MKPKLITTLADYSWKLFTADAVAGVTVAMVALPLSIAIAIASGAPPAAGLITAIVAGFLVSALGGSRVQIGGPTGAFIVVVYGIVAVHGLDGLLVATLMAGVILIGAALLRAGRLIAVIPAAVIEGFTIGIAVIIATSQIKDLLGLRLTDVPADFLELVPALWSARASFSLPALIIGLSSILLIVVLRRFAPRLPGLIIAIGITSAAAAWLVLPVDSVASRYGDLPSGLPMPSWPPVTLDLVVELLPSALIIAFLAGIESLLSAVVADRMTGSAHRSNAELMAQGAANIGSALFGGLPATGAIARTATNVRAGGKTPVAGLIHALTIWAVIWSLAPLAGAFAMPALAGLLMVTAWNMSESHRWRHHLTAPRGDLFLLLLTLVLTVVVDLTMAIAVGTAVGLAQHVARQRASAQTDESPQP